MMMSSAYKLNAPQCKPYIEHFNNLSYQPSTIKKHLVFE